VPSGNTTNDALAQEVAYLAQNWPFGVPLLVQEYGKTAIRTYSGWAGLVQSVRPTSLVGMSWASRWERHIVSWRWP
jgi:hypothetical protein